MGLIGEFFNLILIDPLTNLFVFLGTTTGSAGIGVILLTIFIRTITYPLQRKQMHMMRVMSAMQPRLQEIKKKYKDPRRAQQEQMKLYKEAGVNPFGCFSGMLVQMPILIALYQTFTKALGESPESVIKLSGRLYPVEYLSSGLPLNAEFLWLHLGRPDPFALPVLVAMSTFVLQKMSMMPATDEKQRAQNSMMNLLMPLFFGWITLTLPSGLGLYYALSNIIGIIMQYVYVGRGPVNWRALVGLSDEPVLPRAMEMRQRHIDDISKIGRSEDGDEEEEAGEDDGGSGNGAKRKPRAPQPSGSRREVNRRRYAGGRRRGRR